MAREEATVEELVAKIERGELRLPEMQRRYVWRSSRVRDLLDSLYRGYPSGAILLWEAGEAVPTRSFAVDTNEATGQATRLLLDGQQRLTSLAAVIRGMPVAVRNRKKPIELLFNLNHPEGLGLVTEVDEDGDDDTDEEELLEVDEVDASEDELMRRFERMTFIVASRKLMSLPHWVKVTDVFKSDSDAAFLRAAGVTNIDDPLFGRYSERLARLRAVRRYTYRMDVLERSMSYDEVTEIFVRVNSLGAKLRSSDLALAQITARWRNSLEKFQTFQKICTDRGFELELGIHLKNLVAFATDQSRFLSVGSIPLENLQSAWDDGCRGMTFAINFAKSNCAIESPVLLSSPFLLIALAKYGHRRGYDLSPSDAAELKRWVLLANAKGRYSRGSTETLLDQDLATIRDGGSVRDLVERLRLQVGRLDVSPDELEGRNQRSALFKTMYLAFKAEGACDWQSGLAIAMVHGGAHDKLQFHHIFPKASMSKQYRPREVDDIANLAFIGGRTNRKIMTTAPEKYLAKLVAERGPELLEAQAIPLDSSLWSVERYPAFVAERRCLIAAKLNRFLKS